MSHWSLTEKTSVMGRHDAQVEHFCQILPVFWVGWRGGEGRIG